VQKCSVAAGTLRYDPSGESRPARLFFLGDCVRRQDDRSIEVKLFCAAEVRVAFEAEKSASAQAGRV
jgi:hypothetical protein